MRLEIEHIEAAIARIRAAAGDDEVQHSLEDDLRRDVLRSIAEHSTDPYAEAAARLVLTTDDIEFARWCA